MQNAAFAVSLNSRVKKKKCADYKKTENLKKTSSSYPIVTMVGAMDPLVQPSPLAY